MGSCLETWQNWQTKHLNTRSFLGKNNRKRTPPKAHITKPPSSSVHLVEVKSEKGKESSKEREVALAEMVKLKHPINCKALTKPPKDQKPPLFTGGFVPNKPA
ncbi:unnamed protein product [Prunus armeniaca]